MTPTQFREVVESIAMKGFLAARKLHGVTEEMAYDVKEAVRAEAILCLADHIGKRYCACGLEITEAMHICRPPAAFPEKEKSDSGRS